MESTVSRCFVRDGRREPHVVFPLAKPWWSRPCEYAWASELVRPTDVVLGVARGVCHPFKFRLGEPARETYACDRDPRVTSTTAILEDIAASIGTEAAACPY